MAFDLLSSWSNGNIPTSGSFVLAAVIYAVGGFYAAKQGSIRSSLSRRLERSARRVRADRSSGLKSGGHSENVVQSGSQAYSLKADFRDWLVVFRVVGCLPRAEITSELHRSEGQASDKPQGTKPRAQLWPPSGGYKRMANRPLADRPVMPKPGS